MNENEFQYNGRTYVAKEEHFAKDYYRCLSCAFIEEPCFGLMNRKKIPQCHFSFRQDKREVYFELKKKETTENEFKYDGKTYVAKDFFDCDFCAFHNMSCGKLRHDRKIPHCDHTRDDRRSVQFELKEETK